MFVTLLSLSYKTGCVSYTIWSMTRKDQPRFKIDKTKIELFLLVILCIFLLNIAYCLLILQDLREIVGILVLSLFNTVVLGYGLSFWLLLKEKK